MFREIFVVQLEIEQVVQEHIHHWTWQIPVKG